MSDKLVHDEEILNFMRDLEAKPLDVRELVIENDNPVWIWLMRYGSTIREKNLGTQYESADRVACLSKTDGRLEVGLASGRHRLNWRGHFFEVVVNAEESRETARIHLKDAETCAAFEEFLRYGRERSRRKNTSDADSVAVRIVQGTLWKEVSTYPKRSPESVVTGDDTVKDLLADIRKFIASEEDYINYGRSFKRNVLITGPAGSGKSSIVTVLASELDLDICFISITPSMDEKNLCFAMGNLGKNSMLVIEDVDVLCSAAAGGNSAAQNALSVLTNVLDGALHKHKLISVLTSANPDALEDVLVRHGRIDYTCRMSSLTEKQVNAMVKRVFPSKNGLDKLSSRIWDQVDRLKDITATVLAQFLFRHRDDDPDDLDTKELTRGTRTEHISDSRKAVPDHFYM